MIGNYHVTLNDRLYQGFIIKCFPGFGIELAHKFIDDNISIKEFIKITIETMDLSYKICFEHIIENTMISNYVLTRFLKTIHPRLEFDNCVEYIRSITSNDDKYKEYVILILELMDEKSLFNVQINNDDIKILNCDWFKNLNWSQNNIKIR